MKANELMLGDWVYNKNIDKNMQVYPTMFSQMFRQNPKALTEDYNIFHVLLTPEILEKNGWKREFDKAEYMVKYDLAQEGKNCWLMWAVKEHNLDLQRQDEKLDMYNLKVQKVCMPCDFVHELQHALRLCGISKDIEL